jgi:hypothetical protein
MENKEPYTLEELIEMFHEDTLPKDGALGYTCYFTKEDERMKSPRFIHKDELRQAAIFARSYVGMDYRDGFKGSKTT